jgi:hypothetical protein
MSKQLIRRLDYDLCFNLAKFFKLNSAASSNNLNMNKILFLLISMCLSTSIKSQIIFSTNNQFAADVNVYVTDNQFSADLVVYRCDSQFSATKNAGLWHFTSNQFSADKIIYFTDNQFASDLIIYFTSNQFAAGWSDKSLMHLMYN